MLRPGGVAQVNLLHLLFLLLLLLYRKKIQEKNLTVSIVVVVEAKVASGFIICFLNCPPDHLT